MDPISLTADLKATARQLGFALAGACPAVSPPGLARLDAWLEAGYAGQMGYLAGRRTAYDHPSSVLAGARSIVMLAMDYRSGEPQSAPPAFGRLARYAWGETDYHDLIRDRLNQLSQHVLNQAPGAAVRGVVDTAPLMEREFAQLAGLGWLGKNTLLLNRQRGSWFFLAALLTDLELDYDTAHQTDHCGSCRACLDACPTDAFPQPYVLDASRCISYLTIELKDSIPVALREGVGDWLFGCDVCQEVCPWNRDSPESQETEFAPLENHNPIDLCALLELDEASFRARFRATPLWRARRRGILRNAAIVLGNRPSSRGLEALKKGLSDPEPLVRAASAWAIGKHERALASDLLRKREAIESDPAVRQEIRTALAKIAS